MARTVRVTARLTLAFLLTASAVAAQEGNTFSAALLGTIGGSLDAEPGDDLSNTGFQVNLGMWTEPRTQVVVRAGRVALDKDEFFNSLTDADLTYATIGGEYRSRESYYDSGVYISLGAYRLTGDRAGRQEDETAPGLSIGVTGEFRINRWAGVLVELSGHYADFDESQVFGLGNAGLVFRF